MNEACLCFGKGLEGLVFAIALFTFYTWGFVSFIKWAYNKYKMSYKKKKGK